VTLPGDPTEELLLEARAAAGDRAALRELYLLHRDAAQRVAFRFLGDEAEARDVVQDVFVTLLSQPSAFTPKARFRTWLWRVVANRCLNRRAKWGFGRSSRRAGEDALAELQDDPGRAPDAALLRAEEEARVRAAIDALPERQRMAVLLSRFEGLSYEEVAAALETSVSSVESLLFRARRALADALGRG
jgi:RNA polymerase sigma-70 factor (ECF subfamily)